MKTSKQYEEAVQQAKNNLNDVQERGKDAIGGNALGLIDGLLTPEEIAASDLRMAMMIEIANPRKACGFSQRKLDELIGDLPLKSHGG